MARKNRPTLRSQPCNGELVRHYREQRGWTQDDFAARAGYSKRVIAKAEASGSVQPETLRKLAETLSTTDEVLHVEDLLTSPKALAMKYVETYRRYEHELAARCRSFLAEEMVCIVDAGDESTPLAGTYKSPDGFDTYCRRFFEIFERPFKELYQPRFIAEGNHVMAAGWEAIQLKGHPNDPNEPNGWLVQVMQFSRGKLVRLELLFDTRGFGKALTRWRGFQKEAAES